MSSFSWQLPPPPVAAPPSASGAAARALASTTDDLAGLLDLAFDPLSLDMIDTDDGWFLETTDSRTAVLFQLEAELNAWWGDPAHGSRLRSVIAGVGEEADPSETLMIVDEVKRALQVLVAESVISELSVSTDEDETGRAVILLNYRDSSTGHPVDIAYIPFT